LEIMPDRPSGIFPGSADRGIPGSAFQSVTQFTQVSTYVDDNTPTTQSLSLGADNMMTRKDFQAIAKSLKDSRPDMTRTSMAKAGRDSAFVQWNITVDSFTDMCAAQNPNFDRDRFTAACGVEK